MMVREPVTMASGLTVSVQASDGHYCSPRLNQNDLPRCGEYSSVELGFPSEQLPPVFEKYRDGDDDVFAYVPAHLVLRLIAENGGVMSGELPPMTGGGSMALAMTMTQYLNE